MPNPHDLSAPGNKRRRKTISKSEPMKAEYDFSKAERGKFYHPGADFSSLFISILMSTNS